MASYNLNDALKRKAPAAQGNREMALDDVARVKVLSPGRQVFKRFIRNRLAVFGTVLLATMFVFSFLGPLVYPYGQKEIFYKYNSQNVNYAQAKENTTYTGYVVDPDVAVHQNAASEMNTRIRQIQAQETDMILFPGADGMFYQVDELGENIYSLSQRAAEAVCSFGENEVRIGQVDTIRKSVKYEVEPLDDGFAAAAAAACKGADGSFEYGGESYTYRRAAGKSYDLYATAEGFAYAGEALGEEFEAAAEQAAAGEVFEADGASYTVQTSGATTNVYQLDDPALARVYTRFTMDMYAPGTSVSNELRVQALLAAYGSGAFTADGADYTIAHDGEAFVIRDASGAEYAELSTFIIRRYNGDDTMEYGLKNEIREAIEAMVDAKQYSTTLVSNLPQQNEVGEYSYGEDGNLLYNETELRVTQKDTGEYVINCNQVIFVIDMYAAPSAAHILGTDGDGFDVLARIMYGGRVSLMVGFVVVFLESFLGIIMGGLAGYYGGWVDNLIMRLVDIFYCLPSMPIMIILGAMMDAMRMDTYIRLMIMMAMLGIMGWAGVARLVRGQILSLREQEFMVATEATGVRVKDRIFRHLVPNVMPQLIVTATMGVGGTILTESTLSFLGLGVKHPLATWGTIINSVSSASAMAHYAFIWIPVGLLICLTVIAFNFVGDGLRDAYDPKSKR